MSSQSNRAGAPNLWDLMPDDLRWNNRNKVHNKCNAFEPSQNHPSPQSVEKLSSMKSVPGAKKIGDCCSRGPSAWGENQWNNDPLLEASGILLSLYLCSSIDHFTFLSLFSSTCVFLISSGIPFSRSLPYIFKVCREKVVPDSPALMVW